MPINTMSDGEALLIGKWLRGDEAAIQSIVRRYQKPIFNLIFYLGRCDRDTAYNLAVTTFAEVVSVFSSPGHDGDLLTKLIQAAAEKCRPLPSEFSFETSEFAALPPQKRRLLSVAKEALFKISFEHRLLLLLRDQLNLPYVMIANVLGLSESKARSGLIQARIQFGDKIEENLKRTRGEP